MTISQIVFVSLAAGFLGVLIGQWTMLYLFLRNARKGVSTVIWGPWRLDRYTLVPESENGPTKSSKLDEDDL